MPAAEHSEPHYIDRTLAFGAAQRPADAAATIFTALTSPRPPLRLQTSDAARAFAGLKLADLDGSAVLRMTSGRVGEARPAR